MPVITFSCCWIVRNLFWGVFDGSRDNKIALKSIYWYLLTGVKHFNTITIITTDTTVTIVNMLKNKSVDSLRLQICEYAET